MQGKQRISARRGWLYIRFRTCSRRSLILQLSSSVYQMFCPASRLELYPHPRAHNPRTPLRRPRRPQRAPLTKLPPPNPRGHLSGRPAPRTALYPFRRPHPRQPLTQPQCSSMSQTSSPKLPSSQHPGRLPRRRHPPVPIRRRAKRREERRAIPHPSSPLLFRCAGSQSPGPQSLREKTLNSQPRPQTGPSQAVPADSAGPETPRPQDSVVDMSYASDDYLPLMTASPSSSTTPRRVTRRERDGGLVPPSLYLDTSFEQYANQSVEYLPPAYDDLPPSPMSPITTTPMTHG
ncbi:hypothetical protein L226DRAFT_19057 [Lentinus tigrinus ALCF2SS1-7]|uniref:uncharacterized protein n=1 Tax=Lentinus tigrinus ALCF2SS1-7 TaxID=1328758 RepID=UPI0011660B3F|nr:hypothetical protein L226DRAFT_19057 [Lentinus tigrinus ALCF2SS1-7]